MRVGLFVPCYVDQLRPEVGLASVALFEEQGIDFVYPEAQTCCGQPFLNAGADAQARRLARRYAEIFSPFDCVVTPSGSCAASMRRQLPRLVPGADAARVASVTYELCEFLLDVVGIAPLGGRLERRVGLHASCHALRGLGLGSPSERPGAAGRDPARRLLEGIAGVELVELARRDECCGFGGIFSIEEEAVSLRMGADRLDDHVCAGAEVVTSTDVSCLLQLEGIAKRRGSQLRFLHVAELVGERSRA